MKQVVLILLASLFPVLAYAADPVRIESERLEVIHQKNRAEFTGKVQLRRGDFELHCDRLVAYYKDQAGGELDRAEAFGNVTVSQGEKHGHGNEALYQQKGGILTLTGNAEMEEPGRTIRGETIVHLIESNHTEVKQSEAGGRVHLSIEPDEAPAAKDEKPAAKEEAAP